MYQNTPDTIRQALREKVITKREAEELIAGLTSPRRPTRRTKKQQAVGPIRH